jgi:hypothetical protein
VPIVSLQNDRPTRRLHPFAASLRVSISTTSFLRHKIGTPISKPVEIWRLEHLPEVSPLTAGSVQVINGSRW